MKRIFAFLILAIILVACSKSNSTTNSTNNNNNNNGQGTLTAAIDGIPYNFYVYPTIYKSDENI